MSSLVDTTKIARRIIREERGVMNESCTWVERESEVGEVWESECGETNVYASPTNNNFSYCPFCGKPIEIEEYWGDG